MGVPVLTLAGENFCGRMGASIMQHIGLLGWVAESLKAYVTSALQLVADRQQLLDIKSGLRERILSFPLCDVEGFAKDMSQIFSQLWTVDCADSVKIKKLVGLS